MLMRTFSSFSVEIDATPTNLQLYFADFQRDSTVKEELCDSSLTDFNSKYVPWQKYTEIRQYVVLMSSVLFDCTHRCGQMFSVVKNMESGSRNMSVEILKAWMRILTREIQRDVVD